MDRKELLALFDREQRIEIEYPEARKEMLPGLVRFVRPAPGMNVVCYSALDPATADEVIAAQVAYFRPMNQPFEWMVYDHDSPTDLGQRLVRLGYRPDDDPSWVMVLDLDDPPETLLQPIEIEIRPITRREQLHDVIQVLESVYGGDFNWVTRRMGDHLEIPGYLEIYAIYDDDRPAGVGWIYCQPNSRFANLFGGSTLAPYRRRGLYIALLQTRVQRAMQRGYRFLVVGAGSESLPIVRAHGFQYLTTSYAYRWGDTEKT